ncbi:MAG: ABC transporter substrate-binding protein [Candidatus Rokubacteria bacterium]|nr:ABC transporter substrate-binding protein [Candidatus Rokubacteria bacterium]
MRALAYLLIAIFTLLSAGALGPATPAGAQAPRATGPIKIGVLAPLTGPFTAFARDIIDGARLYLDEVNGEMSRRKVELSVEDYQTRPDVALTKARKLVEGDHVQALVGVVLSAAAVAIKDYVTSQRTPFIISGFAVAETLTLQPSPYVFRITYSASMTPAPIAQWAYKNLKARTAAIIASDSVGPLELIMAFARTFEEAGGKVVQEIYPPLGTADFGPYIARIRRDVDVLGVQVVGADGVRFVKQYEEFGLKGKIPLADASVGFTDLPLLQASGQAALGAHNSQAYVFTIDTPKNKRFVQAFRTKYGRDPGSPAESTYAAMNAIDLALKATGGNIEDAPKFVEALRKVDFEAPRGRIRFDQLQNVISDIHIARIEKVGDRVVPVVVETVRGVDQFLGKDPTEYLKRPRLVTLKGTFGK